MNTEFEDIAMEARFTRLRALLFGFSGINLTTTDHFAADFYSGEAYATFESKLSDPLSSDKSACRLTPMNEIGEFVGVNALQSHPSTLYGLELPKFLCLEDYSKFNEYRADAEGVEDPELGLAAEYYNQRGTSVKSWA